MADPRGRSRKTSLFFGALMSRLRAAELKLAGGATTTSSAEEMGMSSAREMTVRLMT
jgi:hypothetical protein